MSDASLPDDLRQWPTDPHDLFGIGPSAGMRELRRAYAALIRRFKPEHHPHEFRRIRDAYESLEWQVRWRERGESLDPLDIDDELPAPPLGETQTGDSVGQDASDPKSPGSETGATKSFRPSPSETDADLVWNRAIRTGGDWQEVYRQLSHAAESSAFDEIVFCRLYWLLTVAPHVDPQRQPVDWLAAGLARNTSTPRLISLYFQELNRRPAEALLERSRAFLSQPRPIWQLSGLARHRWRALRTLDRLDEIAADRRLLGAPFFSVREEWVQLMMSAVEVLVWSGDEADLRLLNDCLGEIDQTTDVQLDLTSALDRHELLLVIASDYRRYRTGDFDHLDFQKGILQLLPDLWLNSDVARLGIAEILETWVDLPDMALDGLDNLNEACHTTLSFIADTLASLAPREADDSSGAHRRCVQYLIESHNWDAYRASRRQLFQYCLRTGIWLDEILDVLHTAPEFSDLVAGTASTYLREDLPLKCLLAGHRAFWR